MTPFNINNWYWAVAGDPTQVYSSAATGYVPSDNPAYIAWTNAGGVPTKIASEQELIDILSLAGQPVPAGAAISDTGKEPLFNQIPQAVRVWAFAIENRVRVLEGQPTRNANQFKSYVKSLM